MRARAAMTMSSSLLFEEVARRSQQLVMSIIEKTRRQERDQPKTYDGSKSFGKTTPCSLETSMPTADDGIQDTSSNRILCSGRLSWMKTDWKLETMTGPLTAGKEKTSQPS